MNPALVVALIAAVAGPLVAYITAARKMSGRVADSEASSLWQESASIRKDYKDRIAQLEARLDKLDLANSDLRRENDELKVRNRDLGQTCERLRRERDTLAEENEVLKNTIRRHLSD